ncbi:MAG: hypothetical protein EA424_18305, partial [Planctomycetaceae bacterium]
QTVTLADNPTGGTFTLQFNGQTTDPIAYNAPADESINEVQQVSLTGNPTGGTFLLEFGSQTTLPIAYDAPLTDDIDEEQVIGIIGGTPNSGSFQLQLDAEMTRRIGWNAPSTGDGRNEIQELELSGPPTGGTFTLRFDYQTDETTDPIARNATAAAVRVALETLPNIGEGNVQVTGGPLPNPVQIEFVGALAGAVLPSLEPDDTLLDNGDADVTKIQHGTPSVRQALVELPSIGLFDLFIGPDLELPVNNMVLRFQNDLGGQNISALQVQNSTLNDGIVQIGTIVDGRTSVLTRLEALPNINVGDVVLTGGALPADAIQIEFVGNLGGRDVPELIGDPTGLTGGFVPDVEVLTITQGVTSVRDRLEALPDINPGDVVVTGVAGGPYDVEFTGQYAGQDQTPMIGNGDDLTPAPQTVQVDVTQVAVPSLRRVLEAFPNINPGDVTVTGGPLDVAPLRVLFEGQYSGQTLAAMQWRSDPMYGYDPLPADSEVLVEIVDTSAIADSTTISIPRSNITGLAFSPLDFNLWHPTTTRGTDAGHGINPAPDNSRTPGSSPVNGNLAQGFVRGGVTTKGTLANPITEANGHTSMYFGLERFEDSSVSNNDSRYYRYMHQGGQYGVLNRLTHLDLSSNPLIVIPEQGATGGTYNLPGGAYGSLVTGSFSLEGYNAADKPMLYFNYFLETENHPGATTQSNWDNPFRDSARVFISRDDGVTWELLATNNSQLSAGPGPGLNAELPPFLSDSATEGINTVFPDLSVPRRVQQVQELFDNTGDWRQARVDLEVYAGQPNLKLRFDFSTAGSMNDPSLGFVDAAFGEFDDRPADRRSIRSQSNQHEGFYIDDIIVGVSERGEFVTGAAPDTSTHDVTTSVRTNPDRLLVPRRLEGGYQLEIRRGPDYAELVRPSGDFIAIQQTFQTNERLTSGYTLIAPDPADVSDGMQFAIAGNQWAIFEYDTDGQVSEGAVRVDLNGISTARELAGRIRTAINSQSELQVTAILSATSGPARIDLVDAVDVIAHSPSDPSADPAIAVESYNRRGDANFRREQGQLIIENNTITHADGFGIAILPGARDPNANFPHPGVPINFDTPNTIVTAYNNPNLRAGLAPGVVVQNNIVAYSGDGGIAFLGDADDAITLPIAAVPFGRIVNNTIYGSPSQTGTGILVANNAAPTILNNILSGLQTGIEVGASSTAHTISGWNLYQNNAQRGNAFNAVNDLEAPATAPLFRDPQRGNFYLMPGSVAIDSGLNSMQDRNAYVLVKQPLGIPQSPIFAPERDVYGQLRVDLPWADPLGAGPSVFRDRGAVEAADFDRPFAMLVDPVDGNGLDRDPNATVVYRTDDRLFEEFVLQLYDGEGFPRPIEGTGVDPLTVHPNTVSMTRDGVLLVEQTQVVPFDPTDPGDALLRRSSDYTMGFEGSNQVLRLTPASAIWESDRTYVISLNNRDRYLLTAADGAMIDDGDQFLIRDQAGNAVTFEYESGYKMWVPQTLMIHAIAGTQIGDGDTFTISNGPSTVVFEFDNNNTFNPDHRVIRFQATDTVEDVAQAIYQVLQEDRTLGLAPQYLGDRVHIGSQIFHSVDVTSNSNLMTSGIAGGIADGEQFTIEFTIGGVTETVTFEFDTDGIVGLPVLPPPGEDPDDPADDYIEPQRIIPFDFSQTSEQLAQLVIASIRAEIPHLAATTSLDDGFIHLRESIDSQLESYLLDTSSSRLWQTGQPGVTGAMLVQLPDDRYEIQAPAAGGAAINDNEIFTINDGTRTVTFEFDLDGSGPTRSWYISIPLTGTETQDRLARMIQDAITSEGAFPDLEIDNLGAGLLRFAIAPDGAINTTGTQELNGAVRSGVTDGETFQVTRSGTTTLTFEFNNDGTFDPNNIQIGFSPTSSGAAVAQAMITAIGNAGVLGLTPVYLGGGTIRLNETPAHTFDRLESSLTVTGVPGGAVAIPYIPSASFTAENMAGAIISAINRTGFADFEARAKLRGGNTIFLDGAMMNPSLPNPDDAVQSITEDAIRAQYLPGIRDRAGNFLKSNQPDGETRFTIILGEATFDFGDLPDDPSRNDDFRTLLASDGARHVQVRDSQLRLGHLLDVEVQGQPSARADGDDANAHVDVTGTPRLNLALLPMMTIRVPDGWHIDDGGDFSITDADGRQKNFNMTTGPDGLFQVSYSLHDGPRALAENIVATINESMTDLDPLVGVTAVHIGDGLIQIAGASSVDLQDTGLHLVQVAPTRVIVPSDPAASGRALVDDGDTLTIDAVTFTFRSPAPVAPEITDIVFYEGEPPEILVRRIIQAVDAVVAAGQLSDVAALDAGNGVFEVHGTADVAWQGSLRPYWQLPVNIQVTDGLLPLDGNLFTLADGRSPAVVFEFDSDNNLNDNSHQRVAIGSNADQTAANIAAAINQAVDAGLLQELVATRSGSSVSLVPFATTVGSAANDEDGIRFEGAFVPGLETSIVVTVSGGNGMLDGWIDWNNNGRFDAGEQVLFSEPVFEGENRLTITTPESIDIDDLPYNTFARFRLSPSGGLAHHGLGVGGEVEDYRIRIITNTAPVLTAPIGNLIVLEDASPSVFNLSTRFDDDDITNGNGDFLTYSATLLGFATAVTDLDTDGAVHIQLKARQAGPAGEAIQMVVNETNFGDGRGPMVTVNGSTISVELNTNPSNPSTAQQLVNAVNAHSQASALVQASVLRGIAGTLIVGRDPGAYSPLHLTTSIPLEFELDAGQLTLTYLPHQNGQAVLVVTAADQTATTVSDTVTITVLPVNDPPEFTLSVDPAIIELNEDAGAQEVSGWVTGIRPGPPEAVDELIQALEFEVTVVSVDSPGAWTTADFFTTLPTIDTQTGTLTFEVAPNANGDAVIEVILRDDGGTDNGGIDQSDPQSFTISVRPINDPPVLTAPTVVQMVNEHTPIYDPSYVNTPLTFSTAGGNAISVFDPDVGEAAVEELRVTLTVLEGALTLSTTDGLAFDNGDGTDDLSMTFRGSQADVNAALDGLQYAPRLNYNGGDRLVVVVNDLGNFGYDPANPSVPSPGLEDRRTINITVLPVNDPPFVNLPQTSYTMSEDTTLPISGIVVGDPDVAYAPVTLQVTLTAKYGTISVNPNAAQGVSIQGNNQASVRLTGTPAALNATLAHATGIVYRPRHNGNNLNFEDHEHELLTVNVNDLGNVGMGGPKSVEETVTISVTPVNDPPSITSPGPLVLDEDDQNFYFPLIVTDVDADEAPADPKKAVSVVLRLTDLAGNPKTDAGQLIVRTDVAGGLDPTEGTGNGTLSGNGSHLVTITGSPVKITNTLTNATGLQFLPAANWNGELLLIAFVEDHGNTGGGPSLSATKTIPILVRAVNDPPVITVPVGPFSMDEGPNQSLKIYGIGVTDVDAHETPPGHIVVTLSVPEGHGSLNVVPGVTNGVAVNRISGNNSRQIVLTGTPEEINKTLALPHGVTYTVPDPHFNNNRAGGDIMLTILADDEGRTGIGTITTDEETIPITVRPINDPPVITLPSGPFIINEGPQANLTISDIVVVDVDAFETPPGYIEVTLSVPPSFGSLNVVGGLDQGVPTNRIAGNHSSTIKLTGTPEEISLTLASPHGVTYTVPDENFNNNQAGGDVILTVLANDLGRTGAGGVKTDQQSLPITVRPINDPPVISVTQQQWAINEGPGAQVTITGLSVADVDVLETPGGMLKLMLEIPAGTGMLDVMVVSGGVPADRITATEDTAGRVVRWQLSGTPAELNTTLASGVRYEVPDGNFNRLNYAMVSGTDGLV